MDSRALCQSPDLALRGRRFRAPRAAQWGHVCLGISVSIVLIAATGCSMLGTPPSSDPAARLLENKDTSAETVMAALTTTRNQMLSNPREPYWAFRMGEIYTAVDSTARAISVLQVSLEVDPLYAPSLALLSKLYYENSIHGDAVDLLETYLARAEDPPDALRAALALHVEALGDVDRAYALLDACVSDSKEVRAARTFVSLRSDDLSTTLESAKRTLDSNPRSAANHNNYGIALLGAARPDEARKAFQSALKIDATLPGALYNMAIVEAFYFFNDDAGRQWFARYKQYASDDPDDLSSRFDTDVTKLMTTDSKD